MPTIFERINSLSASNDVKATLMTQLFTALLNTVISVAPDRFSSDHVSKLQELGKNNKYQEIVDELQRPFSEEEWNTQVVEKMNGIVTSYEEEVLSALV